MRLRDMARPFEVRIGRLKISALREEAGAPSPAETIAMTTTVVNRGEPAIPVWLKGRVASLEEQVQGLHVRLNGAEDDLVKRIAEAHRRFDVVDAPTGKKLNQAEREKTILDCVRAAIRSRSMTAEHLCVTLDASVAEIGTALAKLDVLEKKMVNQTNENDSLTLYRLR